MKWVKRIQTMDGELHETERAAKKHAEAEYANLLLPLAHKLAVVRYSEAAEVIDSNLEQFVQLKALKDDINLEDEGDRS